MFNCKIIIIALCSICSVDIIPVSTLDSTQMKSGVHRSEKRTPLNRRDKVANKKEFINFLKRVQQIYFELNPHKTVYNPNLNRSRQNEIRSKYMPYNCKPSYLKIKTDKIKKLFNEFNKLDINENYLDKEELKGYSKLKHFLEFNFGEAYDEDYYNGDWMLGPNSNCRQQICRVGYHFKANIGTAIMRPRSQHEFQFIILSIRRQKKAIKQYIDNLKAGVRAGMVRPIECCKMGVESIKQKFPHVGREGKKGILKEKFTRYIKSMKFLRSMPYFISPQWYYYYKRLSKSINKTLIDYFGDAIESLIHYLQNEHVIHCLPSNVSSGMATLPVRHIWINGTMKQASKTTGKLPTGEKLDGKRTYNNLLQYFTTAKLSPKDILDLGQKQIELIYPQMVSLAKEYTGISSEKEAIRKFKLEINKPSMSYNTTPIPANESDSEAHNSCHTMKAASIHCPIRYRTMKTWIKEAQSSITVIKKYIGDLFYSSGSCTTIPKCDVVPTPNFNPSKVAASYQATRKQCKRPAKFLLPFFQDNPVPRYSLLNTAAHEAIPGHHLQVQSFKENFAPKGSVKDVVLWLNKITPYTVFMEGWALYVENPLLAKHTSLYKNRTLSRYGMLKAQMWRALRLVVDTGLHYRGMKRNEAIKLFEKYAWDTSNRVDQEITRYQSYFGQATTYMIGQQAIVRIRNETVERFKEAGVEFDEKEFHYHILRQGSLSLDYLKTYMKKYADCKLNSNNERCHDFVDNRKSRDQIPHTIPIDDENEFIDDTSFEFDENSEA